MKFGVKFEGDLIVFVDGLQREYKKQRRVKNKSRTFNLSNWMDDGSIYHRAFRVELGWWAACDAM
jgi:hypothetical protein